MRQSGGGFFRFKKCALASPLTPNKNYLIHYRINWLNYINNGTEFYIFWVSAHKGISGNEITDSLARKAAANGCKPYFKIPFPDLFLKLENLSRKLENLSTSHSPPTYMNLLKSKELCTPFFTKVQSRATLGTTISLSIEMKQYL